MKNLSITALKRDNDKKNQAIDIFFKSISSQFGGDVLGVVLSGGGIDGVEGAKAIEAYGGKIIVQDPGPAEFGLMPQTLINHDHPDEILTPLQIAEYIKKFIAT